MNASDINLIIASVIKPAVDVLPIASFLLCSSYKTKCRFRPLHIVEDGFATTVTRQQCSL